jgi:hypothetical protein
MSDSMNLLTALGVTGREITLAGHAVTVYELTLEEFAELMGEVEKLSGSGVSVVELVNPATEEKEQYFKRNWFRLAVDAQAVLFKLLALSLRMDVDDAKRISVARLPRLLAEVYEVNRSFFGDLTELAERAAAQVPALQALLKGVKAAGEASPATSGPESSPDSSAAASA